MPRILYGYLLRALVRNGLGMIVLLTTIMTISQLPNTLFRASDNEIPASMILKVLMLMVVANAPVLILLTLLLSVVLTLGQLSSENEITAMRASGLSPINLLTVVALFALPFMALLAALTLQLAPQAFCAAVLVRADAARNLAASGIRPGKFLPFGSHGTLLVRSVAADGQLRDLFLETETDGRTVIVVAKRGRIAAVPTENRFTLTLGDGRYYEGVPGERRFRIIDFREYTRSILLPPGTTVCSRPDTRGTLALLAAPGPKEIAELNMRFGQLALAVLFVLLAVPLSNARPRQGAYARFPAALGIFALGNFGLLGIANWSARAPALGTAVLWGCLLVGLITGIYWMVSLNRVKTPY
jgi:lipopolysaccharide export system permease protein